MSSCLLRAVGLLGLACVSLRSQSATGTVAGTVFDAQGTAIAGAEVTILNSATAVSTKTATDPNGYYSVPLIPPGIYSIEVAAAGFQKYERRDIQLQVQQQLRLDAVLRKAGEFVESIVVNANADVVDAASSSVGKIVDNRRILELPLNSRNVYSLVMLTPGFAGSIGNQYNSLSYSVNGSRSGVFTTLIDGAPADFPTVNGFAGISIFPSVDAVAEFKVQAQNYSADFGRTMTGVMNLVFKSGANAFHGSAYEFIRNSALDANLFFNNARGIDLASFKRNQFGGMFSGPIVRNRTFFLVAYEGLRQRSFRDLLTTVPTKLERSGDFSETRASATQTIQIFDTATLQNGTRLPFTRNSIPLTRSDPIARNILAYYPTANLAGDPGTRQNNYYASGAARVDTDNSDIRIDHNLTENSRLFGRFSYRRSLDAPPQLFPGDLGIAEGRVNQSDSGRNAVVDYTNVLNPFTVLNARLYFARDYFLFDNQGLGFAPSELGFPRISTPR